MESSVNQPHPADDAEAFFGAEEPPEGNGQAQDPASFTPDPYPEPYAEPEPSEPEPEPEPSDPEPEPEPEPPLIQTPPSEPSSATRSQNQSGALLREYVVLHSLPLTKRVLEHLLNELEQGDRGGEPRVALFELHRVEARNANAAVGAAYSKHHDRLGEKADVVAISEKAFQKRRIQPRTRVQRNISITRQ